MNTAARLLTLTSREREVLDLIVKGLSNKEIGRVLDLSWRTIEIHRHRMCQKMDLYTCAELATAMAELKHEQELEQFNTVWMGTMLTMFKRVA